MMRNDGRPSRVRITPAVLTIRDEIDAGAKRDRSSASPMGPRPERNPFRLGFGLEVRKTSEEDGRSRRPARAAGSA